MVENIPADYLAGLPEPQRAALGRVNAHGLAALTGYLSTRGLEIAQQRGWNADAARHERQLGRLWHEFDALEAHAALDQAEGIDHGWAGRAAALHARLVPPGLDPDPLGTVERLVAEQKSAADGESADNKGNDGSDW
jgi:hypothetical protein